VEALVLSSGYHSVLPLPIRCKLLISWAVTATNQKVGSSNLSGRTIFAIKSSLARQLPTASVSATIHVQNFAGYLTGLC
jgi:hypothetical protein